MDSDRRPPRQPAPPQPAATRAAPPRAAPPRPADGRQAARQEREVAALRANLRKRKEQARAREKARQE